MPTVSPAYSSAAGQTQRGFLAVCILPSLSSCAAQTAKGNTGLTLSPQSPALACTHAERGALGLVLVCRTDTAAQTQLAGHYTPVGLPAIGYVLEVRIPSGSFVAFLQNAHTITCIRRLNNPWSLSFSIPANDPKAVYITKANEIWLRDYRTTRLLRRFRVQRRSDSRSDNILTTHVEAECLASQLAQEKVLSYVAENRAIGTIINNLLARQILSPPIVRGTIDPEILYSSLPYTYRRRSVSFENESLWLALCRLRDTYGGYIDVDNDRRFNWRVSVGENKRQQIRYGKNLTGMERDIDYSQLFNRVYPYGGLVGGRRRKLWGSKAYVEDTASQSTWGGIYATVIVNPSITDEDSLRAWAEGFMEQHKNPPTTYRVDIVDLSESDAPLSFERLELGSTIQVIDEDLGIDLEAQVVEIEHRDLWNPGNIRIEISTAPRDIGDLLSDLQDRQHRTQDESPMCITGTAGEALFENNICYRNAVGKWVKADRTSEDTAKGRLAAAMQDMVSGEQGKFITEGLLSGGPSGEDGTKVWLGTDGGMTISDPGPGEIGRIIGHLEGGKAHFKPENDYIELKAS